VLLAHDWDQERSVRTQGSFEHFFPGSLLTTMWSLAATIYQECDAAGSTPPQGHGP